jgi:hypothetical protein
MVDEVRINQLVVESTISGRWLPTRAHPPSPAVVAHLLLGRLHGTHLVNRQHHRN